MYSAHYSFVHISRLSKGDWKKKSICLVLKATASSSDLLIGKYKQTRAATLRGKPGSGIPQGQEKLSQVSSLTSAPWKLSQGMGLAISFVNCSNAGWCQCTNRFIMWVLHLEPESVLLGRVPLTGYRSTLGLDQGRSVKGESDIIWKWQLKEPLNNRHKSSPPHWPSCPGEAGSLAPSKAGTAEVHLLFYCFHMKWKYY